MRNNEEIKIKSSELYKYDLQRLWKDWEERLWKLWRDWEKLRFQENTVKYSKGVLS